MEFTLVSSGSHLILTLLKDRCGEGANCVNHSPGRTNSLIEVMPKPTRAMRSYTPGIYFLNVDSRAEKICGYTLTVTGTNPVPDLVAVLTSPSTVIAGNELTYTLTVDNSGDLDATGVKIELPFPDGVRLTPLQKSQITSQNPKCTLEPTLNPKKVICKIAGLAKGDQFQKLIPVTVDSATRRPLSTQATATAIEGDQNPADDTSKPNTTTVITKVVLSINKESSLADPVVAGKEVTYKLHVDNTGPSDATNVRITDTLPAEVEFVGAPACVPPVPPLGVERTVTCTIPRLRRNENADGRFDRSITVKVKPSVVDGHVLANTAFVTANEIDPRLSIFDPDSRLVIRNADLSITKTAPAEVCAGEPAGLKYEFAVCNFGPSDSADATITDDLADLPAGIRLSSSSTNLCTESADRRVTCRTGPILANKRCDLSTAKHLSFVVDVPSSLKATTLRNTASIKAEETDPNSANDASNTVETRVKIEADLIAVGKTARRISDFADFAETADSAVAGANLAYQVEVKNHGPSDSPGGMIHDLLTSGLRFVASPDGCEESPQGSSFVVNCPVPRLPANQSYFARFVVKVPPDATEPVSNLASVESGADPNGNNNMGSSPPTTVKREADLAVILSGPRNPVDLGEGNKLVYTLTVTNNGPSNATSLGVVSLTLPRDSSFDPASGQGCTGEPAGTTPIVVRCPLADLTAGANELITVSTHTSAERGTATANAFIECPSTDLKCANNTAEVITTLATGTDADLVVTKTAGVEAVAVGDLIRYKIEVTNRGPADVAEAVVTDDLAHVGTFVSANPALDSVGPPPVCGQSSGKVISCVFSQLRAGDKQAIDLVVKVEPDFRDKEVENIAKNLAPDSDPNPVNNQDRVKTTVLHIAPLVLPFFKADSVNDTLFAVRNPSGDDVCVRLDYFLTDGIISDNCEHVLLPGKRTVTRSLRGRLLGEGYVGITPIEHCGSARCVATDPLIRATSPPEPPLSGDFIRIEPPGHASGQLLVSTDTSRVPPELCRNWSVRFLNGGSFEGSTELFFFVPGNTVDGGPAAIGKVYGEDGKFVQKILIGPREEAFRETTKTGFDNPDPALPPVPLLASFGAIEWEFQNGVGNVSAIHRNKDNFAVAVPGFCRDGDRSTASPLLLPYFEVELAGKTTLFAVRNESDGEVGVRYKYFSDQGVLKHTEPPDAGSDPPPPMLLAAHAADTINLRFVDVGGLTKGYIQVVVESSASPTPLLSGDFVRLDPVARLASGGALVDTDPGRLPRQLCRFWNVRFLQGVPLGSTTDFVFHISTGSPGTIKGTVYSESGKPVGMVDITTTSTPAAFQISALDPKLTGSEFLTQAENGSIEWDLGDGVSGNVASILTATRSNKLSVLLPGVCISPL